MPSVHPYIYWLDQLHHSQQFQVGDQAIHKATLAQSNITKSNAFVVSFEAYEAVIAVNQLGEYFQQKLKTLNLLDQTNLYSFYNQTIAKFKKAEIPQEISAHIAKAYNRFPANSPVLLTFSVMPKTLPEAFVLKSQLQPVVVSGDANVIDQIRNLWQLLYHPEALLFRYKLHNYAPPQMAVVVQNVEFPETSGELFTIDPVNGDKNTCIVEAVSGLSTELILGKITPDQYKLTKRPREIIHQEVSPQHFKTIFDKHHLISTSISEKQQRKPKIDRDTLFDLLSLGESLEKYFMHPQRVTWWMKNKCIHIIDSQPLEIRSTHINQTPSQQENLNRILQGTPACAGLVSGRVVVIDSTKGLPKIKQGDIVVTQYLHTELISVIAKAGGVISEFGGQTSHAAIISREAGTPCIVGVKNARTILKKHQIITLNATSGEVFAGGLSIKTTRVNKPLTPKVQVNSTATKFHLISETFSDSLRLGKLNSDGVFVNPSRLSAQFFQHRTVRPGEITLFQGEKLHELCSSFGSRPVFIELTSQANPIVAPKICDMLGYYGGLYLSNNHGILVQELSVIGELKNNYTNLNIVIPVVRTITELEIIKKQLTAFGFVRSSMCKLWITLGTPAGIQQLSSWIKLGFDGVVVDVNTLTALSLGINPDDETTSQLFYPTHPIMLDYFDQIQRTCTTTNTVFMARCDRLNTILVQELIQKQITGLVIPANYLENFRQDAYQTELNLIAKHHQSY